MILPVALVQLSVRALLVLSATGAGGGNDNYSTLFSAQANKIAQLAKMSIDSNLSNAQLTLLETFCKIF